MAKRARRKTPVLARYVLLELPGWVLAGVALAVAERLSALSARTALLLFALWVAKDFALYPLLRRAYEGGSPDAAAELIGALGTVREPLAPTGYVRVGAELWRAEVSPEHAPVPRDAPVRVRDVRGLTLRVEPL